MNMSNWKFWTWNRRLRNELTLERDTLKCALKELVEVKAELVRRTEAEQTQARKNLHAIQGLTADLEEQEQATLAAEAEVASLKRRLGWVERARAVRTTEEQDRLVFVAVEDSTPWWRTLMDILEEQRELDTVGAAQLGLTPDERAYRSGLLARTMAMRDTLLELRERAQTLPPPEV